MQVKIGKEFDVAERLTQRFEDQGKPVFYYTCFGEYDLFEIQMVDTNEAVYNVPFDLDIIQCESSLFYSWKDTSIELHTWVQGFPALVLVFLRIQPTTPQIHAFDIERHIINEINRVFGSDANLFAGMGRSEILLLLRGKSFSDLLPKVSSLRRDLPLSINNNRKYESSTTNPFVIISSTSFPIIAHPALKGSADYSDLEGEVLPFVSLVCNPGCEELILKKKPPSCTASYETYGFHDIAFMWKCPIPLKTFVKEITEFRLSTSTIEGIKSTESIFLGTPVLSREETSSSQYSDSTEFSAVSLPDIENIMQKSSLLDPMPKAQMLELLGHLNSYYRQQDYRYSIQDVLGIQTIIITYLNELDETQDSTLKYIICTSLSEIIDLGNNGLYQRHTELQSHAGMYKRLPFPFLRGINAYLLAASCIPCFVFSRVFDEIPVRESWPGFVVFGQSYSYQLFKGRVLSLPANTLQKPIEDWWGITHEIAHAIYWASDFYNTDLPEDIKQYYKEITFDTSGHMLFSLDLEEIYANWFDFRYVFLGDTKRYFPLIWKSWLRWERTQQFKQDYLLRSLAIYITTDLDGLIEAQNKSYELTIEFLESKYEEMNRYITSSISEYDIFISSMTPKQIKEIVTNLEKLTQYLLFLENVYYEPQTFDRLNPSYPTELLNKHVELLENGVIITEDIPNPIKLLHTLHDRITEMDIQVSLQTTAATVLTLWHKYLIDYGQCV